MFYEKETNYLSVTIAISELCGDSQHTAITLSLLVSCLFVNTQITLPAHLKKKTDVATVDVYTWAMLSSLLPRRMMNMNSLVVVPTWAVMNYFCSPHKLPSPLRKMPMTSVAVTT